jgi:hypothetical protein
VQGPSVEAKSQVKVKAKVKKLALYTPWLHWGGDV